MLCYLVLYREVCFDFIYTFFYIRNIFIRNMRLRSGKNLETIKKHGQAQSLKQGSGKCNE